jgi:hypothetical protein
MTHPESQNSSEKNRMGRRSPTHPVFFRFLPSPLGEGDRTSGSGVRSYSKKIPLIKFGVNHILIL